MSAVRCDVVPIYPSPRVHAVHTIGSRIYTVYSTGVYHGSNEIVSFPFRIVASTVCGQTIALLLADSALIVLNPRMLLDEQYWGAQAEFVRETTGVQGCQDLVPKGAQLLSADYSGSLICVNMGLSYMAIYEYTDDLPSLRLIKSLIIRNVFSLFQIVSMNSMPYLWTFKYTEFGYYLDLLDVAGLSFKNPIGHGALCRLPLNIPKTDSRENMDIKLLPGGERDGTLLVHAGRRLFRIPAGGAIAGDAHPALHPALDWVHDVFYTQITWTDREYYVSDAHGAIFKLQVQPSQKPIVVSKSSVSNVPSDVSSNLDKWFKSLPRGSDLVCIPRSGAKISQCELDTRKWPWRTLILSGSHLTAFLPLVVAEHAGKATLQNLTSVIMMVQVPKLKTLFVSTLTGTGWLARNDISFDGLQHELLLSIGVIGPHLVTVLSEKVQLRKLFAPYDVVATWHAGANDLILDASIGPKFCLLRFIDRIIVIRPNGNEMEVAEVMSGFATSFVRCDEGKFFVGVVVPSDRDFHVLMQKYSANPRVRTHSLTSIKGAVLSFSDSLDHIGAEYYSYIATDFVPLSGGTEVVVHSVDGKVALWSDDVDPIITCVSGSIKVAGRLGHHKQAVILYGRDGLWVATNEGCRMISDRKSRRLGGIVQQACTLEDGAIACVVKGELRFIQSPLSYGKQLPTQLQSVSNIAKDTRMLLVPSKRILILHGGTVCNFMDSVSFEPLYVSGLRAHFCDEICLWQFEFDGERFEQLVFSSGKAAIESYSIERAGREVNLICKLRFLISRDSETTLRTREVLHCHGQDVYLGRHDYLLKAHPMKNKRFGRLYFDSELRHISQVGNYLIVSTERSLNVLDASEFRIRASTSIENGISGHAAGFVEVDGEKKLYILCAREKERFAIFVLNEESNSLSIDLPQLHGQPKRDYRIRTLARCSKRVTETGFSVLAVMMDYSIKSISVKNSAEVAQFIEII